jgi:hypothetical protein
MSSRFVLGEKRYNIRTGCQNEKEETKMRKKTEGKKATKRVPGTVACTHPECPMYDVGCIENCAAIDHHGVAECPYLAGKLSFPESKKKYEELARKMDALIEEYGLVDAAFCGTTKEGMFFGRAMGVKVYQKDVFNVAMNVGRLWQHFRTLTKQALDMFEKKTW